VTTRPYVVFFDMNVWVEMAKGLAVGDDAWRHRFNQLKSMVDGNRIRIVLSLSNYLELWHRGTQASREDIGRLMRDLTNYATFAPVEAVRKLEVDALVRRHVGQQLWISIDEVLGEGVSHAFGSRFGRFRFVESLASADGATSEGRAVPAPDSWLELDLEGPKWEWLNLVGTQEILERDGLERAPQHRLGTARVEAEVRIRNLVASGDLSRARLRDLIITDEIGTLTDSINQSCWEARAQPHGLFMENPSFDSPAEGMRAFVNGLPSVDALATLREWKHRDLNHQWDQHDLADLLSLAVAVPYADTIVTERRWAHLCDASGLARKYATRICALRDVDDVIARLWVGSPG
jgi:hypothetical protein